MNAQCIMVCSGKGGTGKSTVSVLLGACLARLGRKTLLVELDSGLRSVDIIAGVYGRTVYDIEDVLCGRCEGAKAVVPSPLYPGLSVISAPYEGGAVEAAPLGRLLTAMRPYFDFILLDTAAGMGAPFTAASTVADKALLVVSFGHNDANRAKAERYVPADAFGESLRPFWDAARSHGAVCIFASPVAMREFDEAGVCHPSFAAYREAMRAFAAEVGAPFIDLGAATAAANTAFGAERCKARYMWVGAKQDNAHQQNAGACRTAQAFVQQLLQDTRHWMCCGRISDKF